MKQILNKLIPVLLAALLILSLAACGSNTTAQESGTQAAAQSQNGTASGENVNTKTDGSEGWSDISGSQSGGQSAVSTGASALDSADLFSDRDLKQEADLSEAVSETLTDGQTLEITAAGVYVLSGSAKNASVTVEAGDEDKVQLVLDGLNVTNDSVPVIYVKNADKVFVTTAQGSENSLSVTGTFTADGSTNTDAVIFSRDDLVLNGLGSLSISSTDNGVSCKDDLKITGGSLTVSAVDHALEANDSIAVCDGEISVTSSAKDGLHAENEDDNSKGWIYISGGSLTVKAADDGVHAVSILQMDGGSLNVTAAEGLEATWIQINDGDITIQATDDGVNAGRKSSAYTVCVEINGGSLTVTMGQGDTDAIDSNGNLIITGGTINITAQSPFDCDGSVTKTGGTIIVNGVETDQITSQFGGGMGGFGGRGGMGGMGGQGGFGGQSGAEGQTGQNGQGGFGGGGRRR